MGRSENSRNRILSANGERVFTEAADPKKMKDPSLIIYNAMRSKHRYHVVSNGCQTDPILTAIMSHHSGIMGTLNRFQYEPDSPNFTPRITGMCRMGHKYPFVLVMLRKSPFDNSCERFCFEYEEIPKGFGYYITTYQGDGDPLPPFRGEPRLLPLAGDLEEIATQYWGTLNQDNIVSLVVRSISETDIVNTKIINKYEKVS